MVDDAENEISLTAFRLLVLDLVTLYAVMNEGTINVLGMLQAIGAGILKMSHALIKTKRRTLLRNVSTRQRAGP